MNPSVYQPAISSLYGNPAAPAAPAPQDAGVPQNDDQLRAMVGNLSSSIAGLPEPQRHAKISDAYAALTRYSRANPNSALAKNLLNAAHTHAGGRIYPKVV